MTEQLLLPAVLHAAAGAVHEGADPAQGHDEEAPHRVRRREGRQGTGKENQFKYDYMTSAIFF